MVEGYTLQSRLNLSLSVGKTQGPPFDHRCEQQDCVGLECEEGDSEWYLIILAMSNSLIKK